MLMMFSLSYLITTLPVFVIIIMRAFMMYIKKSEEIDFESEFAIAKTLMFANNSFNIMFIILFGKTLRRDMFDLLLIVLCLSRKNTKSTAMIMSSRGERKNNVNLENNVHNTLTLNKTTVI